MADYYYSGGEKHTLTKLKKSRVTSKNSTLTFQTANNTVVKVTNKLIVSFNDLSKKSEIEKKYNLTLIKSLTKNMYLYSIANKVYTLKIANAIYEEQSIEFSHPDFQRTKKTRELTNDPQVDMQWHLKDDMHGNHADINIEEAWKYTKGQGIKVAIYDEGIDINHEDLRENILGYANFNDDNSNVPYSAGDKWHGTACAGIVGAQENHIGGVGVAPESSLFAIRYSNQDVSKDIEAYLSLMNVGVDIITNSWGTYTNLDAYNATFKKLATEGRDGKGIIIIFAAGNESQNLDVANINDESESPHVLSIAASTEDNFIAEYSNFGSNIDFTAPGGSNTRGNGGLFTTDATGSNGYTNGNYNYHFIGTSASAPIVAGVSALILAANPELTRDEVVDVLKMSASKIGNYPYDKNGHNNHWGYGKVNAGKAVRIAKYYNGSKLHNFARVMFIETLK
jgi:subtilisin family serine protease